MTGYILDTSALSAYLHEGHRNHGAAARVIDGLPDEAHKFVSVITLAEFEYGIRFAELVGSTRLDEYRERLEIVRRYAPLDLTHHTSEAYAELKGRLASHVQRRAGQKMPRWIEDWIVLGSAKRLQTDENDLWICAQAKERDLVVVTTDPDFRQFEAVDPEVRILLTQE